MSADEAEQLVESQCADANYTHRAEQNADDGLHYTDNEGPQPNVIDYYIMDNGKAAYLSQK